MIFYILAAITLFSALGIVLCKNLIHSALSMALCFVSIAGLYASLNADFLAVAQLMIYAGTVVILIILGIMTTRRISMSYTNMPQQKYIISAALLCSSIIGVLVFVFLHTDFNDAALFNTVDTAKMSMDNLADMLLDHYVLAFEITAVLLLAAMIGAIILAKGAEEK